MIKRILILIAVILSCIGVFYLFNHTTTAKLNTAIVRGNTKTALKIIKETDVSILNKSNQHYPDYIYDSIFNKDISRGYPIAMAAKMGNYKVTKALVDKGVNLNVKTLGIKDTPLILVLKSKSKNKYKIANYLIDHGAKIKYKNQEDKTAIYYAWEQNDNILVNDKIIEQRLLCIDKCKESLGDEDIEIYVKREYHD